MPIKIEKHFELLGLYLNIYAKICLRWLIFGKTLTNQKQMGPINALNINQFVRTIQTLSSFRIKKQFSCVSFILLSLQNFTVMNSKHLLQ